jgi:hypothetical protein
MFTNKIYFLVAVLFMAVGAKAQMPACPPIGATFCDVTPNDPLFWNESYWSYPLLSTQDIPESGQNLEYSLIDATVTDIQYELFLDLNSDFIVETVVQSAALPAPNTIIFSNIAGGGVARAFDERAVPADQKFGFAIEKVVSGDTITARVRWNTTLAPTAYVLPQLPYGLHRIEWIVSYSNGTTQRCVQDFVVTDCKKPTVVCLNGLSANIMQTGFINLWATDFLQYTEDNTTPGNLLNIGVVRAEESTGSFPTDANGNPRTEVVFYCDDADPDPELVELWCIDKFGNADFCQIYVTITDIFNTCPVDTGGWAKIQIRRWCDDAFVGNVNTGLGSGGTVYMDSLGMPRGLIYPISPAMLANGTVPVVPVKEDDPLNGVDIFDLQAIIRHILGLEPLANPYQILAADANKSGSITSFDLVELRKLIVGLYSQLPNNTSWRFIDGFLVIPDPSNPFGGTNGNATNGFLIAPDTIFFDYVALKVGDVTCDGIPGLQNPEAEDRNAPYVFEYEDVLMQTGETREITLRFSEAINWNALQMSLGLDPALAVLEAWESDLPASEITLYSPDQHALNMVWSAVSDRRFAVGENFLRLRLRALAPLRLSEALRLSGARFQSFALDQAGESRKLDLSPLNTSEQTAAPFVVPNPVAGGSDAVIRYQASAPETIQLNLYDAAGRMCFRQVFHLDAGAQQLRIPASAMPQSGVYFWQLKDAGGILVRGQ